MQSDAFVLAVIGDFGGSGGDLGPLTIDRDRFDAVLARLAPRCEVDGPIALAFNALDDFHPDRLVRQVPALAALLAKRRQSPDAATLARLGGAAPRPAAPSPPRDPRALLDVILGGTGEAAADPRPLLAPGLDTFVQRIVEPLLDRTDRAAEQRWHAAIDELLGAATCAVLHHPRFRSLEAAWRGLHRLVTASETGPGLVIRVVDAPRARLGAAMQRLVEESATPGGTAYAAVVADYTFGPAPEDLALLEQIGEGARRIDAVVAAAAAPGLIGVDGVAALGTPEGRARIAAGEGWRRLRASSAAPHLVLCLPRVLLRVPYGRQGEPVEAFPLEERLAAADHDLFLWGSSAMLFGGVLAGTFAVEGWDVELTGMASLEGMPLHVLQDDGGVLPCAEVVMAEETIARVAEQGLVPVASVRDQDEVRFYDIQTVAGSAVALRSRG